MVHKTTTLSIFILVSLVGLSALLLNTREKAIANITYPHEPSCSFIHPFSFPCLTSNTCPEPQNRYRKQSIFFRRQAHLCCCIPEW